MVGDEDRTFEYAMKSSTFRALRAVANHPKVTITGETIRAAMATYKLAAPDLTLEELERVFALLPDDCDRLAACNEAASCLKTHTSLTENWREEAEHRRKSLTEIEERRPVFFAKLRACLDQAAAWGNGCRWFKDLRKGYFDGGLDARVVHACQSVAMQARREQIAAWAGVSPPTEEQELLASQNENVRKDFEAHLPTDFEDPRLKVDEYRRLKAIGKPFIKLANDGRFMLKVMTWLNESDRIYTGTEEQSDFVLKVEQREKGRAVYHLGFREICLNPKDKRHRRVLDFVRGDLAEWMKMQKPLREPTFNEAPLVWPTFPEGRLGWTMEETPENLPRNEVLISIRLPSFAESRKDGVVTVNETSKIQARVRGNLPFRYAKRIEPIDVKHATQLRPNQVLTRISGERPTKTYLKAQRLRVSIEEEQLYGAFSTAHLTETRRDASVRKEIAKHVQEGERLAVLHYLPGGQRLGSLMIFEKNSAAAVGWSPVQFRLHVVRTDAKAYEVRNGQRIKVQRRAMKEVGVLQLDENPLSLVVDELEQTKIASTRGGDVDRNAILLREIGNTKTQFGRQYLRRVAARICRVCRDNRVAYFLVAGGGLLRSQGGTAEPCRQFFTMSSSLGGALVFGLQKSGIQLFIGKAAATDLWMKDAIRGDFSRLRVGLGVRTLTRKEREAAKEKTSTVAVNRGRRDFLFDPESGQCYSYSINGCWAALLNYFNADFRKKAETCLMTEAEQVEKARSKAAQTFVL